jgi:uncharacterized membrane protein YbhN (UPF0104 family)
METFWSYRHDLHFITCQQSRLLLVQSGWRFLMILFMCVTLYSCLHSYFHPAQLQQQKYFSFFSSSSF